MDEEIERLVVSVRADTQGFARDVATMRAEMEGPFAAGIERTGRLLESSLTRAIQTGKFGFEDLRRIALSALAEIASAAIRSGMNSILGGAGGGQGQGGLLASLGSILASTLSGAPGRATGGPVAPGRAYRVGERGPELFVPTSAGRVEAASGAARGVNVNLTVNVSDNGRGSAPDALQRSSRQMVRSLRRALAEVEV
ncbi:MAG: tail tape measure protein [Sphingorhabdus sp.]|uniref:tail tape measure protein n=1 Tax=Sphingorhabdus sp. TaxID=1902408 RepID=UPI003CC040B4